MRLQPVQHVAAFLDPYEIVFVDPVDDAHNFRLDGGNLSRQSEVGDLIGTRNMAFEWHTFLPHFISTWPQRSAVRRSHRDSNPEPSA